MRLKVYVSSKRTRGTHYVLSDSQVIEDSTEVFISSSDLVRYLEVKQEYENWQRRIRNARRCGWV